MTKRDDDRDLQHFLPAELRARWAVLPRYSLYQLFIAGTLLGAALALIALGFWYRNQVLGMIAAGLMIAMYLQNLLFRPLHRRYETELKKFGAKEAT